MKVIGVFDSGFGGLTVLRELLPRIPDARYVYLGDTARLPYGSKSRETIARYAISSAKFLVDQGAELLVIACNTATALALDQIRAALPIPVIGVVEPGARAALAAASASPAGIRGSEVVLLATAATTQSGAYTRNLTELGLRSIEKACPLLVPLVEEGWLEEPAQKTVTLDVLRIYLLEALEQAPSANILLLGCTHYPLLTPLIETTLQNLHHRMQIIDSAAATAQAVSLLAPGSHAGEGMTGPECVFYATDSIEKFQRLGSRFLRRPLAEVRLIDLGG
ncbi:glutamate racemase [Edaphobacter sp. HDX4]|uniref:glutamate racemase n=1 Tax=Edaphobacter sp. HDX4 TaxID=2794064 RepID=UPI002FE57488